MNPDRRRVSTHEAGHAIAATVLGLSPVAFSLLPDGKGGHVSHGPANELTTAGCRAEIVVSVAGTVAERIAYRHRQAVMGSDTIAASRAAVKIHGTDCSPEQIEAELARGERDAERLLRSHWPAVRRLARQMEALYGTLDGLATLLLAGGHQDPVATALELAPPVAPLRIAATSTAPSEVQEMKP